MNDSAEQLRDAASNPNILNADGDNLYLPDSQQLTSPSAENKQVNVQDSAGKLREEGENSAEVRDSAGSKEAQLAARIAALKTLQPGDIVVYATAIGTATYTCIVADSSNAPYITFSSVVRTREGTVTNVEFDGISSVETLANWPGLRIHRTTEGVL